MEIGVDRILSKMQDLILELAFYEKIDLELDDDIRDLVEPEMVGYVIVKIEKAFNVKLKRDCFKVEDIIHQIFCQM